MKYFTIIVLSLLWSVGPVTLDSGKVQAQDRGLKISKESVWRLGQGAMDAIRIKCGSLTGIQLDECFISSMESSSASPQALAFTRTTGGATYIRDYRDMGGKVNVAYIHYPFRANDNYGCYLVNGDPTLVDVDDQKYQPRDDLRKDPAYASLAKKYPNISLWPGNRSSINYPLLNKLPGNGQRFVVRYLLSNGCHTCQRLGNVWFAFDFDAMGKFVGTKLMGIDRDTKAEDEVTANETEQDDFSDPKKPINVSTGKEFTIVIGANHTTGFLWELTKPLDRSIVELVRKEYKIDGTGRVGAGGKEVWIFRALEAGTARISMKYTRPWEKNGRGVKIVDFDVMVKK
jgi:predicted secreted protein